MLEAQATLVNTSNYAEKVPGAFRWFQGEASRLRRYYHVNESRAVICMAVLPELKCRPTAELCTWCSAPSWLGRIPLKLSQAMVLATCAGISAEKGPVGRCSAWRSRWVLHACLPSSALWLRVQQAGDPNLFSWHTLAPHPLQHSTCPFLILLF